jgi:dephospho-CoA kinase
MLIGIVGTLGGGKGTVVEYLKNKNFSHYSVSGKLKEILEAQGVIPERNSYSKLATEIRAQDPTGLVKLLYKDIQTDKPEHAIMEALHDVPEVEFVKNHGGIIIGLDADIQIRYERSLMRGSEKDHITFKEFKEHIRREEDGSEGHNIRAALELADHLIENNGSIEELYSQIEDVLKDIQN